MYFRSIFLYRKIFNDLYKNLNAFNFRKKILTIFFLSFCFKKIQDNCLDFWNFPF